MLKSTRLTPQHGTRRRPHTTRLDSTRFAMVRPPRAADKTRTAAAALADLASSPPRSRHQSALPPPQEEAHAEARRSRLGAALALASLDGAPPVPPRRSLDTTTAAERIARRQDRFEAALARAARA